MKLRKDFKIFVIIQVVLLLLATFFDYSISLAIYERSSLFSKSVHVFAPLPVYILLAFFSAGIFNSRRRDGSSASRLSAVLGFIGTAVFGFLGGYDLLYNMNLYSITLTMAFAIGVFVCCYIFTKLICDHHAFELRKVSKFILISWMVSIALSFILITFIHRVPFRRLDESIYSFRPWYLPEFQFDLIGYTDRAFPSLLVVWNMLFLTMNMLPFFVERFKLNKALLMIISYSWLFMVAVSQIVLGYAYLSDVVIAMLMSNIIMAIVYYFLYKKGQLKIK